MKVWRPWVAASLNTPHMWASASLVWSEEECLCEPLVRGAMLVEAVPVLPLCLTLVLGVCSAEELSVLSIFAFVAHSPDMTDDWPWSRRAACDGVVQSKAE